MADADWRDFRAQLVARSRDGSSGATQSTSDQPQPWAHTLPGPEQGCVLLANPLLFKDSQQYFRRSVILVTDHDSEHTRGIIMNKATGTKINEAEDLHLEGTGFECFGDCEINLGGDLPQHGLVMLHPHGVDGAREIRRGIYEGGGRAVTLHVAAGKAEPRSVRWFVKYAGWGCGQLAEEIERKSWFCVACSPELLMTEPTKEDPDAMWHAIMQLLDEDYRRVSNQVKADARFD